MIKKTFVLFFIGFWSVFAFAKESAVEIFERPLLTFHSSPAVIHQGERASLLVQVESGFTREEVVLNNTMIDGVPVSIENSSGSGQLWSVDLNRFNEIKNHIFRTDIGIRNSKDSDRLKNSLAELNLEIADLNIQIANEPDVNKRAALVALRDQKTIFRNRTQAELDAMVTYLKSESFSFSVISDPNNINYPIINSVSPSAVLTGVRTTVVINGARFGVNPTVTMGGLSSTVISSSNTQITVLAPNFSSNAVQTVEISFPPVGATPQKNAILTGGFFSTSTRIMPNIRPVAVTPGYIAAGWPVTGPVQLSSANSGDANSDTFEYLWEFVAVAKNSSFVVGATLPKVASPSFTPDKKGIYRIKLTLHELSTAESYYSFPSIITIEVN